jgi:hypothetical protein
MTFNFKNNTPGFLEFIPQSNPDNYQKIGPFTFPNTIPINKNQIIKLDNCIIIELSNNIQFCTFEIKSPNTYPEIIKTVS